MYNERQILLGLAIFQDAHKDRFPWMESVTNGGAMESMAEGDVTGGYLTITNTVRDFSRFVCPTDKMRFPVQPGHPLTRNNVSYFMSLDATSLNSPSSTIITGDRHLELGGNPVGPGLFTLSTNSGLGWTAELHPIKDQPSGALGFADGHVQWVSLKNLSNAVAGQKMTVNRIVVP